MAALERLLELGRSVDASLAAWLMGFDQERSRWKQEAERIEQLASTVCAHLGLGGALQLFGSTASGFGSVTSDVDLVFTSGSSHGAALQPLEVLQNVQAYLEKTGACYNLTRVFRARAPLLKLTDESGIEVDMQVNNHLGVRNTQLMAEYHKVGGVRVDTVVRVVKEWARKCGLVGTVDGLVNSYAWSLLAIYYLQVVGVLPNLQFKAQERNLQSVMVEGADTRFAQLSPGEYVPTGSAALASAGALLCGFFAFYGNEFDWRACAVCPRLARQAPHFIWKRDLNYGERPAFYIEDPFDQRTNLAHGTTLQGRERILEALRAASTRLQDTAEPAEWSMLCPDGFDKPFSQLFLKMRLKEPCRRAEAPRAVWKRFEPFQPSCVFVRTDDSQAVEVFIQFQSWQDLRSAQSANESNLACCDDPLALYISLGYGLLEELDKFMAYYSAVDAGTPANAHRAELAEVFKPLPFATRTGGYAFSAAAPDFVPGGGCAGGDWGQGCWGADSGATGWDYGAGMGSAGWGYGVAPGTYGSGGTAPPGPYPHGGAW